MKYPNIRESKTKNVVNIAEMNVEKLKGKELQKIKSNLLVRRSAYIGKCWAKTNKSCEERFLDKEGR
jgi:hypothetical protein